jgi:hypothetical protein
MSLADAEREQRLDEVIAGYLQAVRDGTRGLRRMLLSTHRYLA